MKIFLLLALTVFMSQQVSAQKDPIVATVNGKTIKKSTLLAYHEQNLNFIQGQKEVTLEGSLNDLIDRIIGIENAKKDKIHERPEVVKKMNDIVYHAFVSEELTPKLQKIKVTDEDIKNYYKKYPEYKTSQILLRLRTLPTDEEVAEIVKQAGEIYREVAKGVSKANKEKFAELAQKFSQSSSAITGGDMGYQPRTRLTKQYFEAIDGAATGTITKPFRSQYGFHIVMVTGKKTFNQIDKKIYEKIVYDQKRNEILSEYFAKQRTQAKIKINEDAMTL